MFSDQLRPDGFYVSRFIARPSCRHKYINVRKSLIPSTLHKSAVTQTMCHIFVWVTSPLPRTNKEREICSMTTRKISWSVQLFKFIATIIPFFSIQIRSNQLGTSGNLVLGEFRFSGDVPLRRHLLSKRWEIRTQQRSVSYQKTDILITQL